jgi:hypothetical protein
LGGGGANKWKNQLQRDKISSFFSFLKFFLGGGETNGKIHCKEIKYL